MRASSTRRSTVPSYSASVNAPFATANSATLAPHLVHASASLTHTGFESRISAARSTSSRTDELSSYHAANRVLANSAEAEERANHLRKVRRLQQQNAEWKMQYELDNAAAEKERREILRAQDEVLAATMLRDEGERMATENERRRVCEGSEEIAALTEKLAAAQMNAARHQQLLSKQQSAQEEKAMEAEHERLQQKEREEHAVLRAAEAERQQQLAIDRAAVLKQQCEEKEQAKVTAYEQFVREKQMIEGIVQQIAREDEAKRDKKRQAQEELQLVIKHYLQQRSDWRAQQERKAKAEMAAIDAYTREMEARQQQQKEKQKAKNERDDLIYAAISAEMQRKEKEREEMERMLAELYTEQKEREMMDEVERQSERVRRMRDEMKRENELAMERKRLAKERAKEDEAKLQQSMADQLERDREYEAASRDKRARMKRAYQQEIADMLTHKQRLAAEEAAREEEDAERKRVQKQRELDIVEKERERLLLGLATQLHNYLPKGVYRDDSELERIRALQNKVKQSEPSDRSSDSQASGVRSGRLTAGGDGSGRYVAGLMDGLAQPSIGKEWPTFSHSSSGQSTLSSTHSTFPVQSAGSSTLSASRGNRY